MHRQPPTSPLFPYTTLFRSCAEPRDVELAAVMLLGGRFVEAGPLHDDAEPVAETVGLDRAGVDGEQDRKSTRLNSSHPSISYAVFCLKKKNTNKNIRAKANT